jgi:hypothetical protein
MKGDSCTSSTDNGSPPRNAEGSPCRAPLWAAECSDNGGELLHARSVRLGGQRSRIKKTRQRRSANRHQRQRLSQWERGVQERHLGVKTALEPEHINESNSTKTCPACGARNHPSGRDYRCTACSFACHRDAVGAINILQKALYGSTSPSERTQRSVSRISGLSSDGHPTNARHTPRCSAERPEP